MIPALSGYDPTEGRPNISEWFKLVRELTHPYYDEANAILDKIKSKESNV